MALSTLTIGLIAGLGSAGLFLIVGLSFTFLRRKSSRTAGPSYTEQGGSVALSMLPPDSSVSINSPPPIYQLHKADGSLSSLDKKLPISPPAIITNLSRNSGVISSPFGIPLSPVLPSPNPRSASYHSKVSSQLPSLREGVSASLSGSWLPRYMVACNTFTPRSNDEMLVTPGERLRLLEIFEDQWCLVQRVGNLEGELGVIPTFCLAEPVSTDEYLTVPRLPFVNNGRP